MRDDIIDYLHCEVKKRCVAESNFFGMGCYYHIKSVVKNAQILAQSFKADIEIAIIAAWLHDIASITDYSLYDNHHIHGAKMANVILQNLDYDKDKIKRVEDCILNHRGSINGNRLSLEAIVIADADAISHFDNIPSLLYLAYVKRGLDIDRGRIFVKEKLMRSYEKLSKESKEFYKDKFQQVMQILE